MQPPRPARSRASAGRRASRCDSPSAPGCRRARRRPAPHATSSATATPRRNPGRRASRRSIASRPTSPIAAAPQHDRLVDAGHQPNSGAIAAPRRHRDRRAGRRAAHVGDRRQRHDGVAQPVGREDDQTIHRMLRSEGSPLRSVPRMKIALLQVNPTVGDLAGNARLILDALASRRPRAAPISPRRRSSRSSAICRAICCSVPASCGGAGTVLDELARDAAGLPPVLVGLPEPNPSDEGRPLFNTRGAAARRPRRQALSQGAAAHLRRLRRGPLLRAVSRRAGARHRRHAPRHQHLRGHLERSRLLEAAPLPPRSDRRAGPRRRRRRSSTCRRRRSPPASTGGAKRCWAAWRASTASRSPTSTSSAATTTSCSTAAAACSTPTARVDRARPRVRGRRRRLRHRRGRGAHRAGRRIWASSRKSGARWCSARATTPASAASPRRCSGFPAASTRR